MGHASRSSVLLHMEASLARVSQSGLKTGGGATVVAYVAPSQMLHRGPVEDGLRWTLLPLLCCFPCFRP
jgi:hypothetical protein